MRVLYRRDLGQRASLAVKDQKVVVLIRIDRLRQDKAAAVGGDIADQIVVLAVGQHLG